MTDAGGVRTGRAIDLVHLSRQTFGDPDLEREVLALFRDQCVRLLRTILEGAAGDRARMAAHTLKGAARGVGAFAVAEAAERFETARGAEDALASLEGAIGEARAAIDGLLDAA